MNILEIYPNFSWWLEGSSLEEIEQLRLVAQGPATGTRADAFEKLAPARAFYLVGDAATFDLIPGVFDEVIIHYTPTLLKRLVLESRLKTWIKPTGTFRFQPDFTGEIEHHPDSNDDGLRPVWMVR